MSMIETIVGGLGDDGSVVAAQLLRDVNVSYDVQVLPPDEFAVRLKELIAGGHITVLNAPARRLGSW